MRACNTLTTGKLFQVLDCELLAVITTGWMPVSYMIYSWQYAAVIMGGMAEERKPSVWLGRDMKLLLILPNSRVIQLHLPLSGSGVVQFFFCLPRSSLRLCTRSGLESCAVLLLLAFCSNLLTLPWDRLMKSGLKSSKASLGGKRDTYSKMLVGGKNTVQFLDINPVEREKKSQLG